MREAAGWRCLGRNTLEIWALALGGPKKRDPGGVAGIEAVLEGRGSYSQGTDRVMPAEAKYFMQPTVLAGRS